MKTYSRSYEEADLFDDPMGRDDVSALAGGGAREADLREHRAAVEETLKREFGKLVRRILDRLIVAAVSDESAAETLDATPRPGRSTRSSTARRRTRAADEERGELDLVDDVMFTLVPEDDKKTMWSACAKKY